MQVFSLTSDLVPSTIGPDLNQTEENNQGRDRPLIFNAKPVKDDVARLAPYRNIRASNSNGFGSGNWILENSA